MGGGLGRTPRIGQVIREFVEVEDLISGEAILRVYNLYGRRDNKYKARIKILVEISVSSNSGKRWTRSGSTSSPIGSYEQARGDGLLRHRGIRCNGRGTNLLPFEAGADTDFRRWLMDVKGHREPGYNVVHISLKPHSTPGDLVTEQFYKLADIKDRYNQGYV